MTTTANGQARENASNANKTPSERKIAVAPIVGVLRNGAVKRDLTAVCAKTKRRELENVGAQGEIFKKTRGSPRKWGYYLREFVHYINIVEKETGFWRFVKSFPRNFENWPFRRRDVKRVAISRTANRWNRISPSRAARSGKTRRGASRRAASELIENIRRTRFLASGGGGFSSTFFDLFSLASEIDSVALRTDVRRRWAGARRRVLRLTIGGFPTLFCGDAFKRRRRRRFLRRRGKRRRGKAALGGRSIVLLRASR